MTIVLETLCGCSSSFDDQTAGDGPPIGEYRLPKRGPGGGHRLFRFVTTRADSTGDVARIYEEAPESPRVVETPPSRPIARVLALVDEMARCAEVALPDGLTTEGRWAEYARLVAEGMARLSPATSRTAGTPPSADWREDAYGVAGAFAAWLETSDEWARRVRSGEAL